KLTAEPWVKPSPLIVTSVPAFARPGVSPVIDRVGVKASVLLPVARGVVIEIAPAVAPFGTVASTLVEEIALKVGRSEPKRAWVTPAKAVPSIVTVLPVIAELGERLVTLGTSETTTAVAADAAGVPPPLAFEAVTTARSVWPIAAAGTVSEPEVAF